MIGWFYNLLALSLGMTPIIIVLLWMGPVLGRRYSSLWRYILWMVIAVRLLLPISFTDKPAFSIHVPVPEITAPITVVHLDGQENTMVMTGLAKADISLVHFLLVLYVGGLLIYIAHGIVTYYRFRRNVLRWGRRPSTDIIETLLREEMQDLNIRREIPLRISKMVTSPMIVGLVKPVLVFPTESYHPAEIRMIITHELVHFRRHDIWIKTMFMAATALHWFNPVVHLMVREANKDIERSCDDYVLRNVDVEGKKCYCNIILNLALQKDSTAGPIFSTSISSSRENLEARIGGIFDTSKRKPGIGVLTSIALLAAMSGVLVTVSDTVSLPIATLQNEHVENPIDAWGTDDFMEDRSQAEDYGLAESPSNSESGQDITMRENNKGYATDKQTERVSSGSNKAEVVVVDLLQLETALAAQGPTVKSER